MLTDFYALGVVNLYLLVLFKFEAVLCRVWLTRVAKNLWG